MSLVKHSLGDGPWVQPSDRLRSAQVCAPHESRFPTPFSPRQQPHPASTDSTFQDEGIPFDYARQAATDGDPRTQCRPF